MQLLVAIILAAQQPAPPTGSDVTVTGPQEQKICRAGGPDRSSATRISRRRICLTPTQWRQREAGNTEEAMDTLDVNNPGLTMDVPNSQDAMSRQPNAGGMAPR